MKRGLMNSVSVLSTLLCVATIVLWVRSYWVPENIGWVRESWPEQTTLQSVSVCLTPMNGKFTFDYTRSEQKVPTEYVSRSRAMTPNGSRFIWHRVPNGPAVALPATNWLGFGYTRHDGVYGNGILYGWDCTVPGWLPALVFAAPPALWLRFRRRLRKRVAAGQCENCGYDLRASPARCPECGDEVTHSARGA